MDAGGLLELRKDGRQDRLKVGGSGNAQRSLRANRPQQSHSRNNSDEAF
jgi:hypothetical protein